MEIRKKEDVQRQLKYILREYVSFDNITKYTPEQYVDIYFDDFYEWVININK